MARPSGGKASKTAEKKAVKGGGGVMSQTEGTKYQVIWVQAPGNLGSFCPKPGTLVTFWGRPGNLVLPGNLGHFMAKSGPGNLSPRFWRTR